LVQNQQSHADTNWDPWEAHTSSQQLVVYNAPMDKGKRKAVQEPRFSSHLQQKQTEQGASSKGNVSSRLVVSGTDSLLDNFSFVNFSNAEVIGLFKNIDFSLDIQENIKINIINKLGIC
jgi:hypothetical protein